MRPALLMRPSLFRISQSKTSAITISDVVNIKQMNLLLNFNGVQIIKMFIQRS